MAQLHRFFLVLFVMLGFTVTLVAQETVPSNGLVPDIGIKSKAPYGISANFGGDIAYGYGSISGSSLSLPIPAGTPITLLTPFAFPIFGSSGVRGGDGNYYFIDAGPPPGLYQFDEGSGIITFLGTITGMGSESANGICYSPSTDTYYLAGGVFLSTNNLYTLDIGSLAATLVGGFPNPGGAMIDIAVDDAGVGFGYDLIDDNAYTFDPSNPAGATILGSLGYDANFGQGMDIDRATGTIYLSAFNNTTFTGQLRTMDPLTGMTSLVADWGFEQIAPFAINNDYGPPVGPGPATDPIPANGATNVSILISDLMWTNPPGATQNEVYFGTNPGSLTLIHSGSLVSSVPVPGPLVYNTTYYWRVNEIDGSGTTTGSLWNFTTEQDPNLVVIFEDHFDTFNWTIVGLGGTNWSTVSSNLAGGDGPPELQFSWTPSFVGASYCVSPMIAGWGGFEVTVNFTHFLDWFSDPCGPVGLAYTTDGGATFNTLWEITPTGNVGPEDQTAIFTAPGDFQLAFYYNGDSFNIDFWYIDDVIATIIIPVELTSFTANVKESDVTLNWSTATETNNQGFDIERKSSNGQYEKIGYVAGHGTVSEIQNYSYTDKNLTPGTYSYRLKQIDFDGQFEYSDEVEVEVVSPKVYELSQNYPNPFNPSTTIRFTLAADSKVTLTVFDVLGQKVAELINGQLTSGLHTVNFDASNLNSGVYFYRIDASGVDGTSYSSVKKMSLTK